MSTVKNKLTELVIEAVTEAQRQGKLPSVVLPPIIIERPQKPEHGDYASSLPLKLARAAGRKPLDIAAEIIPLIPQTPEIEQVTAAPPGFINFVLNRQWLASQVDDILQAGDDYGNHNLGEDRQVQIEYVSVNPTGPLHVGHGRGAILGSTLANVLSATSYQIEQEYYINDAGNQVDTFTNSLYARYCQQLGRDTELPSDGYVGHYMVELADEIIAEVGDKYLNVPQDEATAALREAGLQRMLAQIKADLDALDVNFDVWFSEQSLYDGGQYETAMSQLLDGGYIGRREGATWFISTALGEDKDNVVIRGDGSPTYFATDIAYHYNKFIERQFDRVINILSLIHI